MTKPNIVLSLAESVQEVVKSTIDNYDLLTKKQRANLLVSALKKRGFPLQNKIILQKMIPITEQLSRSCREQIPDDAPFTATITQRTVQLFDLSKEIMQGLVKML